MAFAYSSFSHDMARMIPLFSISKISSVYLVKFSGCRDRFEPCLHWFLFSIPASVGRSPAINKLVSASVMDADGMFQGFSYVPPAEDAFS